MKTDKKKPSPNWRQGGKGLKSADEELVVAKANACCSPVSAREREEEFRRAAELLLAGYPKLVLGWSRRIHPISNCRLPGPDANRTMCRHRIDQGGGRGGGDSVDPWLPYTFLAVPNSRLFARGYRNLGRAEWVGSGRKPSQETRVDILDACAMRPMTRANSLFWRQRPW